MTPEPTPQRPVPAAAGQSRQRPAAAPQLPGQPAVRTAKRRQRDEEALRLQAAIACKGDA